MSFQQGLSGLNAAAKNLEIIGNNVSNANTVGFKTATAQFSDIFARSLSEKSSGSVGRGTNLDAIVQNFSQGAITSTNNPLDMAINGKGFFKMKTQLGETIYTRNGQFSIDGDGFIQGVSGTKLMGFPYNLETGQVSGTEGPIQFPQQAIAPKLTEKVGMRFNLDSRQEPIDATANPFSVEDLKSYNHTLAATVYDQLGVEHSLAVYFRKSSETETGSEYEIFATLDGQAITEAGTPLAEGAAHEPFTQKLTFGADGKLNPEMQGLSLKLATFGVKQAPAAAGGGAGGGAAGDPPPVFGGDIALAFDGSTNYGSPFGVNSVSQDGYDSAALSSFSVTSEGILRGRYTNGQTQDLAQISLVTFRNPDGLRPIGNNAFVKTAAAGTEFLARDDDTASTSITSGALESANLDLTNELVNIITAQRIYQANAQTVKAQDSILQTLVNLR